MKAFTILFLVSLATGASCSNTTSPCSIDYLNNALPLNATIISAQSVSAGGSFGEGAADIPFPTNPTNLTATCALIVNVTTSDSSFFRFGLFMPTTTWNERYMTVGNGGFAGGINWLDMGAGLQYGFAVASTDTGHNSSISDLTWALDNPEKQLDFGFRAIHGTTEIAKQLVQQFYNASPKFSYYSGCSTGGRQGIRDAYQFPDDFDGLLVGAPAWWTVRLQPWTTRTGLLNLPATAPNHIGPELFSTIAAEAIRQCDPVDGVTDGIISSPDTCNFDASTLLCSLSNSTACLTAEQVQTVNNIHADYVINGTLAFPGMKIGAESLWVVLLGGSSPNPLGDGYIQNFLLNNASWTADEYTDDIVALADSRDPGNCTIDNFDMSPFRDNGGKVLLYHGLADGLIATGSSNVLYEGVANATGGIDSMDNWFRFFLVPGMGHCTATAVDAPWYFAGANQQASLGTDILSVPGFMDAKHDALLALMDWVENDTAIDTIIATTWENSTDPSSGVKRQRPLCPFPTEAKYDGTGDVNSADSWTCA